LEDFRLAAFGSERHESGHNNEERRMTIDKIALFETTKALWPAIVRVSGNPSATHEIYQANEDAFSENDNWRQLALWAFHQALGAYEKRALAKGLPLYPHQVAFDEFDARMRANLNGADCWLDERAEYGGS
jgi:hypothetical protein